MAGKSPQQLEQESRRLAASLDAEAAKGANANLELLQKGYRALKQLVGADRAARLVKPRTLQVVGWKPQAKQQPAGRGDALTQGARFRHQNRNNSSRRRW